MYASRGYITYGYVLNENEGEERKREVQRGGSDVIFMPVPEWPRLGYR
jgi:hypothetical protein